MSIHDPEAPLSSPFRGPSLKILDMLAAAAPDFLAALRELDLGPAFLAWLYVHLHGQPINSLAATAPYQLRSLRKLQYNFAVVANHALLWLWRNALCYQHVAVGECDQKMFIKRSNLLGGPYLLLPRFHLFYNTKLIIINFKIKLELSKKEISK